MAQPARPISRAPLTARQRDRTYRPNGYGMSESLQRARKPFLVKNALIGSSVAAFAIGVYTYAISAVKQDDFSDVEDLLPPLSERSKILSIEDEEKRKQASLQNTVSPLPLIHSDVSSAGAIHSPLPSGGASDMDILSHRGGGDTGRASGTGLLSRLSEVEWVRRRGLVDDRGNLLVWGAPSVDREERMGEGGGGKGPRIV